MKTLTLVVPSFNSADYLHRCLDSLPLEEPDVEVIVVDDGSTDRTAEVAERYARDYPRTLTVVSKPNGGHGSAINTGLARATGESSGWSTAMIGWTHPRPRLCCESCGSRPRARIRLI